MNYRNTFGSALLVLTLATAGPAFAEIDQWDANKDTQLDRTEFDSRLDQAGLYDEWDADNDGVLTNEEFNAGLGENTSVFNQRFGENAYETWNTDGAEGLTEEEFAAGIYEGYDADKDTYINPAEYEAFEDDAGEGGFWDI